MTHLGRALYEIGHADGWDSLDKVDGEVLYEQDDVLVDQSLQ